MNPKQYLITLAAALGALSAMPAAATAETPKHDPIMVKLEGKGDAIPAFMRAAEAAGGSVTYVGPRSAIAGFGARQVGASITAQGGGSHALRVIADREKSPGGEDDIAQIEARITDGMSKEGFTAHERRRGD